ncbi:unnamed protein product [Boreogadus saida]
MNDLFVAIRCCKTINTSNCWKGKNAASRKRPGSEARGSWQSFHRGRQGDEEGEQLNWNRTVSSSQSEGATTWGPQSGQSWWTESAGSRPRTTPTEHCGALYVGHVLCHVRRERLGEEPQWECVV